MLPVYDAIQFLDVLKGGRTFPWVMNVNIPNRGIVPYVVKHFTTEQIQNRFSVECEVIGNVLAQEFSLPVPRAAYIDIGEDVLNNIPIWAKEVLDGKDNRIKFGSELINPANPFLTQLDKKIFKNKISIDTAFAFDHLIRNRDRVNMKPNLLLSTKNAFLIDHELGFENVQNGINEILNRTIYVSEYHIFFKYLKKAHVNTKRQFFNEFEEYLRLLNINDLFSYFKQLEDFGYSTRKNIITDYLSVAKQNSVIFTNQLRQHL